jgi:hypothetical protein
VERAVGTFLHAHPTFGARVVINYGYFLGRLLGAHGAGQFDSVQRADFHTGTASITFLDIDDGSHDHVLQF